MEIKDYLEIARRRFWILLLIPLVSACAAAVIVWRSPPMYSATATLTSTAFVGGSSNQFTGTQAASQFAAAFMASATGPSVLAKASETTNVSVSDLEDHLTVNQNGASSDMTLTYASKESGDVVPVLTAIKRATLDSMFGLQVTLAESQVAAARSEVVDANQRLANAAVKFGSSDPRTVYREQLARVAVDNLTTAQIALQAANSQLDAVQSDDNLFVSTVNSVSRASDYFQVVVPVVAAGIFNAVILVVVLEVLRRPRRSAQA